MVIRKKKKKIGLLLETMIIENLKIREGQVTSGLYFI